MYLWLLVYETHEILIEVNYLWLLPVDIFLQHSRNPQNVNLYKDWWIQSRENIFRAIALLYVSLYKFLVCLFLLVSNNAHHFLQVIECMWIFSASMRKRETDILLRGKKFELSAHTHTNALEKKKFSIDFG